MRSPTKVSPDSVPSLSATTAASTFTDQVVRELFPMPQDDGMDIEQHRLGQSLRIEVDRESLFGSDISVASEGTYVSIDDDDRNIRITQNDCRDGDSPVDGSKVKIFPGHGAINLAPNFTSSMFQIFDTSQKKGADDDALSTANSVNDAVTEIASNIDHSILLWERKIDSLEREIATLKGIIKSDSVTILNLKTELSEYQEKDSLSQQDMISEQGSELSAQQKREYEETIQHLHDEIEVLTNEEDCRNRLNNESQLQLQNELFASQIIESETEIRHSQDIISQISEENVKLSMELSELRAQPVQQKECMDNEKSDSLVMLADLIYVKDWMTDIEKKLESGFYCRCTPNKKYSEFINVDTNALDPSRNSVPLFDREVDDDEIDENHPSNEPNCMDIEVMIDGTIMTTVATEMTSISKDNQLSPQQMPECSGAGEPTCRQTIDVVETECNFCDCLLTKTTAKETD